MATRNTAPGDAVPSTDTTDPPQAGSGQVLRRRAEEKLKTRPADEAEYLPGNTERMIHELRVHQIELEVQNEELRRAQEELEASRARYFDLYDLAPVGYFTLNGKGLILEANLTAAKLFGVARRLLVKQLLTRFIFPEDQDTYYRHRKQLFETGAPQLFELRLMKRDGFSFWAVVQATASQGTDGASVCRVVISDITERKRAEEALREKSAELEHFTYLLSHNMRSPLVTIQTFLGQMEQDMACAEEGRVKQDWGYIHAAADKMARLLDELLDLSRVGHKMNLPEKAPLQAVVKEALNLVAGRIAERGVKVEITEKPAHLHGDRVRLVEVFQNLLDNACKFMGDQRAPRVEIGVEQARGETVYFVRDNGIGIDLRHQPKLFGLFEKLDPHSEGTGIGLALVKRIVEVHGGRIWAESEGVGKGTTFRFTLRAEENHG